MLKLMNQSRFLSRPSPKSGSQPRIYLNLCWGRAQPCPASSSSSSPAGKILLQGREMCGSSCCFLPDFRWILFFKPLPGAAPRAALLPAGGAAALCSQKLKIIKFKRVRKVDLCLGCWGISEGSCLGPPGGILMFKGCEGIHPWNSRSGAFRHPGILSAGILGVHPP